MWWKIDCNKEVLQNKQNLCIYLMLFFIIGRFGQEFACGDCCLVVKKIQIRIKNNYFRDFYEWVFCI